VVISPGLAGEPLAALIALRGFAQWRGELFAGLQGIVDEHDEQGLGTADFKFVSD
jgi:hypothetical protein